MPDLCHIALLCPGLSSRRAMSGGIEPACGDRSEAGGVVETGGDEIVGDAVWGPEECEVEDGGVIDAKAPRGATASSLGGLLNPPDGTFHHLVLRSLRWRELDDHIVVVAEAPKVHEVHPSTQKLTTPYLLTSTRSRLVAANAPDFRRTPYTVAHRESLSNAANL